MVASTMASIWGSWNGSFEQALLRSVKSMQTRHFLFFCGTTTMFASQFGYFSSQILLVSRWFCTSSLITWLRQGVKFPAFLLDRHVIRINFKFVSYYLRVNVNHVFMRPRKIVCTFLRNSIRRYRNFPCISSPVRTVWLGFDGPRMISSIGYASGFAYSSTISRCCSCYASILLVGEGFRRCLVAFLCQLLISIHLLHSLLGRELDGLMLSGWRHLHVMNPMPTNNDVVRR